jgi:DNA-directed RNA polymerase subunit RPC12/RpoP
MSKSKLEIEIETDIIVACPHCKEYVSIAKLNCRIFRHAVLKNTNTQIDPHASKERCDEYVKNNAIHGCGKPFEIIQEGTEFKAIICDYI